MIFLPFSLAVAPFCVLWIGPARQTLTSATGMGRASGLVPCQAFCIGRIRSGHCVGLDVAQQADCEVTYDGKAVFVKLNK
jgi:hypothetical protein